MGKQINQSIVIDAKVKTTLEGMNEVVSKLNQGLRNGTTKIDLTKGIGGSLSKNLDRFKDEYSKFSKFIEGGKIEFADAKDAVKSGEALIKTFREMKRIVGDFDDLSVIDAKKLFPDAFDSRVSDLLGGLDKLSSAMTKFESKQIDLTAAQTEMQELRDRAKELETIMQEEITLKIEAEGAQGKLDAVEQEIEAIRKKASEGITLKINTARKEAGDAKTKRDEILAAREARGFNEDDFAGSRTGSTKFKGKTMAQWTAEGSKKGASDSTKAEVVAAQEAIRLYEREKSALADLSAIIADREKQAKQLSDTLAKLGTIKLPEAVAAAGGSPEEITEATAALERQGDAIEANAAAQGKYKVAATQAGKAKKEFDGVTSSIEAQQAKIDKLTLEIGEMKKEVSTEALEKAFSSAGVEGFTAEMLKSAEGIEDLRAKLNNLDDKKLEELKASLSKMGLGADEAERYIDELRGSLRNVETEADGIKRAANEMEALKNQVLQFFSITNSVQLLKRAVTSALSTIKELDATMTEAAVVTEFDIGDMWNKLPEYSAYAQELGVSINGMYQATTLYYQQGLKTNEAMALGVETMKMAKIAAMDSTNATTAMTAALRGFNMELNETSATRVNDVYSQLAAVTAADVSQISTAMEKTASIAASANMEFETTAALLAQIIETTQEAPETAGTAMKTIIARFSEVKELRSQGATTGKDSEGEDIDVNKIQTALREVGISMNGFFEGTEGLDSILLKLAGKWGSLDFETQRYIATMAAGSRQQSRFIAMMSDYERTQELVGEANNSAGASQEQFNKTLDSMESKLQRLENAWKEFLMGLSNNTILKAAVDTLTFIIEGINKMTDSISGGNGLIKSITSLATVIGALKLGKGLLQKGGNSLGGMFGLQNPNAPYKETITETKQGDNIVRTVVKEPYKQGEQAGVQAGDGFVAGFKRAVAAGKTGGNVLESMFTSGPGKEVNGKNNQSGALGKLRNNKIQKKHESRAGKGLEETAKAGGKTDYLAAIADRNQGGVIGKDGAIQDLDISAVSQVYDDIIAKGGSVEEAAAAANQEVANMGGTLMDVGQKEQMAAEQANGLALNMGALGGAAMGIGAALGGLSAVFEALGMDEAAEATSTLAAVFMGLGTVMTTLSSIAPMLGMSFTTAGVQITVAGVTSQLAWWWVFLIIAAVALLVVGVIALAKAAKAASLAGRMEAAAEATKAAAEAAEAAKKAYDDLLSQRDAYKENQAALENMTKGTDEWKTALIEANNQVLELLKTYPQLAKYLTTGKDGQMQISSDGWQEIMNSQQKAVRNTQAQQMSSQMDEFRLQGEQAEKELDNAGRKAGIGHYDSEGYFHTDYAAIDKLSTAYELDPDLFKLDANGEFSSELQELASSLGYSAEKLYGMRNALGEFDAAMTNSELQTKSTAKAMVMSGVSEETASYDYASDVADMFANQMTTANYEEREEARAKELYSKDGAASSETSEEFKRLAKEYNVTNEMVGDDLKDLQTLYASMAGISKDDIPASIKDDKEALAKAIAKMDVAKEVANSTEEFVKKMQSMPKEMQKQFAGLVSGNASNFKVGEINEIQDLETYAKKMGYNDTAELAKDAGYTDMTLSEMSTEDQKAYIDRLQKEGNLDSKYIKEDGTIDYTAAISGLGSTQVSAQIQLELDTEQTKAQLEETKNEAKKIFEDKGIEGSEDIFSNSSVAVMKGVSEQIEGMSQEDAAAYMKGWQEVVSSEGLAAEDVAGLEEYLATVDWSNLTEATQAMQYMQSKGVDSTAIQNFWKTATDAANAYVKSVGEAANITSMFQGQIKGNSAAIERLLNGEGTAADLELVQAAGVDLTNQLMLTADGWKITEVAAEQATEAMVKQTADQAAATLQAHKDTMAEYHGMVNDTSTGIGALVEVGEDGSYSIDPKAVTADNADAIADQLGLDKKGEEETDEEYIARIQQAAEGVVTALNNEETTTQMLEHNQAFTAAAAYSTDEQQARYLAGEATEQDVIYSAQNEAMSLGLDSTELELFAQQLGGTAEAYEQAISNMKMNSGLGDIIGSYDTWTGLIDESSGLIKATTGEDIKAYNDLKKSVNKMLNTSEDLSDEFWNNAENMKNLKKAAEGDTEALEALQKAAAKDYLQNLDLSNQVGDVEAAKTAIQEFADYMDGVDIPELEAGVKWDGSGADEFIGKFNEMAAASNMTAEQIQESVKAMGFDAEIDYVTDTRELPIYSQTETRTTNPDGSVTVSSGTPVITGYESVEGIFPVVKTLTSTGAGGGGVSTSNTDAAAGNSGGGGGGSSYSNSHDKSYNTYEQINALLREREKIERRYNKLISQRASTFQEIKDNIADQIENLKEQANLQKQLRDDKAQEIEDLIAENSQYSEYVTGFDRETGAITIDWEAINNIEDSEEGEAVDEFISQLEGLRDQWQEAQDSLDDIEDGIYDILQQGKDEYFDLEDQTKEALMNKYQEQIDEMSNVNDSINDTNSRILDAMQQAIDDSRQERDNVKTEEEIADKQQRLAYLSMDTSGANQLEILNLQDEIDQAQQDYTDTLIDQKISELQRQNDEAADQRQQQIDIAQAQLDQWVESGAIWDEVERLIAGSLNADGSIKPDSELMNLLKQDAGFESLSKLGQMDWMKETNNMINQALVWLTGQGAMTAYYTGEEIEFTTADGQTVRGTVQADGTVKTADGKVYNNVTRGIDGKFSTDENYQNPDTEDEEEDEGGSAPEVTEADKKGVSAAIWNGNQGWGSGSTRTERLAEVFGADNDIQKNYVNKKIYAGTPSDYSYSKMKTKFTAYETGGLADFTGPAWLDGTKAKPEYILNADQTKAFFTLVDVLSSLQTGTSKSTQNNGDNTYDIDINVESIGSDYDVEQLAETVKRMINEDARYRNNNTAGSSR